MLVSAIDTQGKAGVYHAQTMLVLTRPHYLHDRIVAIWRIFAYIPILFLAYNLVHFNLPHLLNYSRVTTWIYSFLIMSLRVHEFSYVLL